MKLHDYQLTAVNHLRTHPRAGLLLDMGAYGKVDP